MELNEQVWWYVARASGLVAWLLLTGATLWGVVLSTRLLGKRVTPAWLLDLHRHLGALATIFTALHLAGLVADSWIEIGAVELLVPFTGEYRPVAVAWGVLALYVLVAVEVSSLLKRRLPVRLWRRIHQTSALLWVLATAHTLAAGTDAGNPLLQWVALLSVLAVVFAAVVRVLSPEPDRAPRPAQAPVREDALT